MNTLWIGRTGLPLSCSQMDRVITSTVQRVLGVALSPKLFKICAPS